MQWFLQIILHSKKFPFLFSYRSHFRVSGGPYFRNITVFLYNNMDNECKKICAPLHITSNSLSGDGNNNNKVVTTSISTISNKIYCNWKFYDVFLLIKTIAQKQKPKVVLRIILSAFYGIKTKTLWPLDQSSPLCQSFNLNQFRLT